jgi:hypothetical protein
MSTDQQTVRMPVTVEKRHGRGSGYVARFGTYPHDIEVTGATVAAAKENLTAALVTAVDTILTAQPRFGRDDDGAFLAAVPTADGGSRHWRVTDTAWGGTSSSRPASEAFDNCYHQTVIPNR